jgi:multidrug efflux pump subunit AcrA (membrane-fusion protein)
MRKRLLVLAAVLAVVAAIAWGAIRMVARVTASSSAVELPTTRVKRGRVTITVAARGELQGGNSEMLTVPQVGGGTVAITYLREPGELVEAGDVVVQLDTTQQEYNLREAEADLAEAEQQVIKAQADSQALDEETRYQVESTTADVKLAELDIRKNPLLAAIVARQNVLALEAARNRQHQAEQDLNNKKATASAGVAIQQAALNRAKVMMGIAQNTIDGMTLKAKTSGYVNIQQNSNVLIGYYGMQLLPYQLGDNVNTGMAVAQIPDLENWEVSAQVGELDRGHLTPGQEVSVAVVALAGKTFPGHVKSLGGTGGSAWDRHFECRISLDQPSPELRPGMTSNLIITVETLENVIWVPSQALFESDGRTFVYLQTPAGFMPRDVTLVRRSESQAVLTGVSEGAIVAMSSPDRQSKPAASQSAMKALQQ